MPNRNTFTAYLIAVVASVILFGGMSLIPTHHRIDVGGYDSAYVQGFFDQQAIPPEFAQSGTARWSGSAAAIIIPQLGMPTQFRITLVAPTPKQLTLRANNDTTISSTAVTTQWQSISGTINGGQTKPFSVFIAFDAPTAPWQKGDLRQVGVLVDSIDVWTPWFALPYPAQIIWVGLLSLLLGIWTKPFLTRKYWYLTTIISPAVLTAITWRWQLPYPYPIPSSLAYACALITGLIVLRQWPVITQRWPWWSDVVVGIGVSWWWGALIWAQQTHVTLAVPGVEKDFRSFVTRSDTLAHVFQADPFYNLGYPFILWAIQQLTHMSAFDAGRWWAVSVAGLALLSSWWLARTLVGRGWDALMVLCVAGSGLFVQYSLLLGSDMTFTWLCILTIAFIIYAPQRSQWWWLGAGISAGAAYLVRHTGLVLCLTCLIWMLYQQRHATLTWRQIGLFGGGLLVIALPQLWVNFRDTGGLLFNYQAKNSWLAVYGNLDWGRWGDVPDSIGLTTVILNNPSQFITSWWQNISNVIGSGATNAEFERAIWQRLLSVPANWASIAGIVAMIPVVWQRQLGRNGMLLLLWAGLFVAISAIAFILPRFLLPLVIVAAYSATWVMQRYHLGVSLGWRALILTAVCFWQFSSITTATQTTLSQQPADEQAVLQYLVGAHPTDRLAFAAPSESPIGKYSALVNQRVHRTTIALVDIPTLCQSKPDVVIWSTELQDPPRYPIEWQRGRYIVFDGALCDSID